MAKSLLKAVLLCLLSISFVNGQVSVGAAPNGANICVGSTRNIGDISVIATLGTDFEGTNNTSYTFILTIPSGFSLVSISGVGYVGSPARLINFNHTVNSTNLAVKYEYKNPGVSAAEGFTISGLTIQALQSNASGIITRLKGTIDDDATVTGSYLANYGILTSINTVSGTFSIANSTICGDGNLVFAPFPNSISGFAYNFYNESNNLLKSNASNFVFSTIAGSSLQIKVKSTNGFCENSNTELTATGTAFTKPTVPTSGNTIVKVCLNSSINPSLTIAGSGNFQWYTDPNLTSPISGATSTSYTPTISTSTANAVYDYYVVEISANGCVSPALKLSVVVQDVLQPTITNLNATYCKNADPVLLSASPTISGTNYVFTNSGASLISVVGTNSYFIPSAETTANPIISASVLYLGCVSSVASQATSVVGIPSSTLNVAGNTICGSGTINITPTPSSGVLFNFYDISNNLLLANANSYSVNTTAGNEFMIKVRQTNGVCQDLSQEATVSGMALTKPLAPNTNNSLLQVCLNSSVSPLLTVSGIAGANYKWYTDLAQTVLTSSGINQTSYSPPISTNIANQVNDFYVTQSSNNCESPSVKLSTFVQDLLQPTITNLNNSYCNYDNPILLTASPTVAGATYSFSCTGTTLSTAGTNFYVLPNLISTTTGLTLKASVLSQGCISLIATKSITIFPKPLVDFNVYSPMSTSENPQILVSTPTGGFFSGAGVISTSSGGYQFDPSNLATTTTPGIPYLITLSGSLNGCSNVIAKTVNVYSTTGIIRFAKSSYCAYDGVEILDILTAAGENLVSITGMGISGSGAGPYTFNPSNVTILGTPILIRATRKNSLSIDVSYTQTVIVYPRPSLLSFAPTNKNDYCPNENQVPIQLASSFVNDGSTQYKWVNKSNISSSVAGFNNFVNGTVLGLYTNALSVPGLSTSSFYTNTLTVTQIQNGCESNPSFYDFKVHPLTSMAGVVISNYNYCTGKSITGISANGSSVRWYSDLNAIPNSPSVARGTSYTNIDSYTNTLTTSSPVVYNLFATQTLNGCESYGTNVLTVTATVKQTPIAPIVTQPGFYCQTPTVSQLINLTASGTGNFLSWYQNTTLLGTTVGLSGVFNSGIDQRNSAINRDYLVSTTNTFLGINLTFCESAKSTINITVFNQPIAPRFNAIKTYCPNENLQTITLQNDIDGTTKYNWYRGTLTVTGLVNTLDGSNLGLTTIGVSTSTSVNYTTTLSATQTQNGCESTMTGATFVVFPLTPSATTGIPNWNYCTGGVIRNISASGTSLKWYSNLNSIPNSPSITTNSFNLNPDTYTTTLSTSNTTVFPVFATQTLNGCESYGVNVLTVTASVKQTPVAPIVTQPGFYCQTPTVSQLINLTASGTGNFLSWYQNTTLLGTTVGLSGVFNSGIDQRNSATNRDYLVSTTNTFLGINLTFCESAKSTINITVFNQPIAPRFNAIKTYCPNENLQTITLQNDIDGTTKYNWYRGTLTVTGLVNTLDGSNLGLTTIGVSTSTSVNYTTTLSATQTQNGCESTMTGATFVVFPLTPSATTGIPNWNYCTGGVIRNISASGTSLKWYSDLNSIPNSPSITTNSFNLNPDTYTTTLSTSNTTVFPVFATQTLNGCESYGVNVLTVTASVKQTPSTPIVTQQSGTLCKLQSSQIYVLTATGVLPTSEIKWYETNTSSLLGSTIGTSVSTILSTIDLSTGADVTKTYLATASQTFTGNTLVCTSGQGSAVIALTNIPTSPILTQPKVYCPNENILPIQLATPTASGVSFSWYYGGGLKQNSVNNSVSGLTLGVTTDATVLGITINNGTTTSFNVTQTKNNCESLPTNGTFTVYPLTSIAGIVIPNYNFCSGTNITGISANGNSVRWYSDLSAIPNSPTAIRGTSYTNIDSYTNTLTTSSPVVYNLFATQTLNGCESYGANVLTVTASVKQTPSTPILTQQSGTLCKLQSSQIYVLTATGVLPTSEIKWYENNTSSLLGSTIGTSVSTILSTIDLSTGADVTKTYLATASQTFTGNTLVCTSGQGSAIIALTNIPSVPILTQLKVYCPNEEILPIQLATPTAVGTTFNWYYGGIQKQSLPINTVGGQVLGLSTNASVLGLTISNGTTTSFTVTQTARNCESLPATGTFTVYPLTSIAGIVIPNYNFCSGTNIIGISANGNSIRWYSDLSAIPISPTAIRGTSYTNIDSYTNTLTTSSPIVYNLFATQTLNGCESYGANVLTVTATVKQTPVAPIVTQPGFYCQTPTVSQLINLTASGTGNFLSWYQNTTLLGTTVGLSGVFNSGIDQRNSAINRDYLVSTTNTFLGINLTFCESAKSTINITVFNQPIAPRFNAIKTYCPNENLQTITLQNDIDGTTKYNWYRGTLTVTGLVNTLDGSNLGLTTIGVSTSTSVNYTTTLSATQTQNGCESTMTGATFVVFPLTPSATTGIPNWNYCTGGVIRNISASGTSLKWYSNLNSIPNSPSITTNSFNLNPDTYTTTLSTSNTTVFPVFATQTLNGCESYGANVLTITASVKQTPIAPLVTQPAAFCQTENSSIYIMSVTAPGANYTLWYENSSLLGAGSILGTSNLFNSGIDLKNGSVSKTFNVTSSTTYVGPNLVCTSNQSAINIKVNDIPVYSFLLNPVSFCGNGESVKLADYLFATNLNELDGGFYFGNNQPTGNFDLLASINGFNLVKNTSLNFRNGSTFLPSDYVGTTSSINFLATRLTSSVTGCSATQFKQITINPAPIVDFSLASVKKYFCNSEIADSLIGSPALGSGRSSIFSGDGVFNNKFTPSFVNNQRAVAIPLSVAVSYNYTDLNNCSAVTSHVLTVNPTPVPTIFSASSYCIDSPAITLNANPDLFKYDGGIGTSTGVFFPLSTITGSGAIFTVGGQVFFSPSLANANDTSKTQITHPILYRATLLNKNGGLGCISTVSSTITVNKLPNATFTISGLTNYFGTRVSKLGIPDSICRDASIKLTLDASNRGGNYSISFGTNPFTALGVDLKPADFPLGKNTVRYIYNDLITSCVNSSTKTLQILALPTPIFDLSTRCVGDVITYFSLSTVAGTDAVIKYNWSLSGNGVQALDPDSFQTNRVIYNNFADYRPSLKVITKYGCENSASKIVNIGPYPDTSFTTKNICQTDVTLINNFTSIKAGKIDSLIWNFGDGEKLVTTGLGVGTPMSLATKIILSTVIGHTYADTGIYRVQLRAVSNNNCASVMSKNILIVPKITVTSTNNYLQTFENGKGGFVPQGTKSSWQLGVPKKKYIKSAASGANVWVTSLTGSYNRSEKSYIQCPCFDYSAMVKPMISLKIRSVVPANIDGAVIQATDSDDNNWVNVGSIASDNSQGLNWYGQTGIQANPGQQLIGQYGWSYLDTTSKWVTARFKLDSLKKFGKDSLLNKKSVRFRIAFASTENAAGTINFDGFAFDDFGILERDKKALIENFTSSAPTVLFNSDQYAFNLANRNPNDVVQLNYHLATDNQDDFNKQNIADPSARSLYYGVARPNYIVLNGNGIRSDNVGDLKQKNIDTTLLQSSKIAINLSMNTLAGNNYAIGVSLVAQDSIKENTVLFVALVERQVKGSLIIANSKVTFEWVMRKMLPDAAGTAINKAWIKGAQSNFVFNGNLAKVYDPSQVGVVVFLQSRNTKQIYQSAYIGPTPQISVIGVNLPSSIEDEMVVGDQGLILYPNPVQQELNVVLPNQWLGNSWKIFDISGREVLNSFDLPYLNTFSISTNGLTNGLYYLQIKLKENKVIRSKFVIQK